MLDGELDGVLGCAPGMDGDGKEGKDGKVGIAGKPGKGPARLEERPSTLVSAGLSQN